jgi:hypothetical protein
MPHAAMRAKFRISSLSAYPDPQSFITGGGKPEDYRISSQTLVFYPVSKAGPYPSDGSDEDNTYARYSPSGRLELTIANPALQGKFKEGDTFYLDFIPVDVEVKAG